MGANTKIFVFKAKELIYTGIFLVLGVLFLLLFIFMFLPKQDSGGAAEPAMDPISGIYSSSIHLGGSSIDVKVTVTDDKISSISLSNLSEKTAAMYPLLQDTVDSMNKQLEAGTAFDELVFSSDSQYTNTLLKQAVKHAISKASTD